MHQDEEQEAGDGQTFNKHGQKRRILLRNENDEIDGQRLEERDELGANALQLRTVAIGAAVRQSMILEKKNGIKTTRSQSVIRDSIHQVCNINQSCMPTVPIDNW